MMSKTLLLKLLAAVSPLCVAAPTIALPVQPATGFTQLTDQPLLAQADYYRGHYRRSRYRSQPRMYSLSQTCRQLMIDTWFCQAWLQEVRTYRRAWSFLNSNRLLSRLQTLSEGSRSKLGTYGTEDLNDQDRLMEELGIPWQAVDARVNRRFHRLFPERRGLDLLTGEEMTAQIWRAIRSEEVRRLAKSIWQ